MSDEKPKHLFIEYPYSISFGSGKFYQVKKQDDSVTYYNEKTMELIRMIMTSAKELKIGGE